MFQKKRKIIRGSLNAKGSAFADPLVLTNPLNSCTKLQIAQT